MIYISALTSVRAIFFDLDDTILDVKKRKVEAAFRLSHLKGVNTSRKSIEDFFNSGKDWRDVLRILGIPLNNDVVAEYIHFFMEAYPLTKLQFGVKNALRTLQKRFRLFVVTSRWYRDRVEKELDKLGILKFFENVITRELAANYFKLRKLPLEPFSYQREILYKCALQLTGLLPQQVVAVGDSARELVPAKKLGMKVIAVSTGVDNVEELKKVTPHVIASLNELDKLDIF